MKNNNNIAAAVEIEAARNLKIYNALADIARDVFNHLNAEEGRQYTAADIARAITGGPVVTCVNGLNYRCDRVEKYEIGNGLTFADDYSPETVYSVEIDNFSCRVNGWKIFDVLERAARAWNIATAARVIFEKKRAAAPVVVSFTLSAAAARELSACCAKDILRPVMNGVHLDTRRRCLVASDGHIMRVLQLGAALAVDESAAASSYIIPVDVLKSGRVVTIDANDIASTDKKSAPVIPGRYPNYFSVIPAASEAGRVAITPAQWKEIKKVVADVAKVHPSGKYSQRRVIMSHESYSDKLIIYALNYDFNVERETAVNIDATAPAFSLSFDADQFLKIGGTPTAFYLKDNSRAIVTTDAAGLSLCMPMLQPDGDKYYTYFNFADGAADLLPGVDIAAAAAELKEEHEHAAALEIVAKVREECKGKSTAKMLKYIDDNFGWSAALQRARTMLKEEIEREQNAAAVANDDTAAPVEITTTANDTTANDDSERETPAPVLDPVAFVDVCETPANDDTAAPGHGAAPVESTAPVVFWTPANDDTRRPAAADIERDDTANDDTPRAAVAYLKRRARRLAVAVAAAVAALLLLTVNDRPAPSLAAPVIETAPAVLIPDVANDDTAAPAADIETSANDTTAAAPVYSPATAANVAAPVETPPTMEKRATAKKRQPRARRHRETAPAAVIVANDTTANDSARALRVDTLKTVCEITAPTDSAAALRVDTLEAAGEITAPAAADIDTSTTANDDTPAPVVIGTDESDSDTAAPSSDDTANDDTQTDGTTAPTSGTAPTAPTTGTPATVATPAPTSAPAAPVAPVLML